MKTKISTSIENIGPATAQAYLANSVTNRRLQKALVRRLVHAMNSGGWRVTHQGIAFDENGKLIDGQHRLTAVVQSGKTVQMNVSRYSSEAPMSVLDSGISRSVSDRVQISGIIPTHSRQIVATINVMLTAETGVGHETLQVHEIAKIYNQEADHIAFAMTALGALKHVRQMNSVIVGAFAYCSAFAPKECGDLATMVRDKVGYTKGSAAHAFVMALTEDKLQAHAYKLRIESMARVLWLIRQHIEGRPVDRLKTTASIFTWASHQRQTKNRLLMPLLK